MVTGMATKERDTRDASDVRKGDVKVHRPRKQKAFSKDEVTAMTDHLNLDGFITFTIIPRYYNSRQGRFEALKGHSITARAFSIEALRKVLDGIEGAFIS